MRLILRVRDSMLQHTTDSIPEAARRHDPGAVDLQPRSHPFKVARFNPVNSYDLPAYHRDLSRAQLVWLSSASRSFTFKSTLSTYMNPPSDGRLDIRSRTHLTPLPFLHPHLAMASISTTNVQIFHKDAGSAPLTPLSNSKGALPLSEFMRNAVPSLCSPHAIFTPTALLPGGVAQTVYCNTGRSTASRKVQYLR